MESNNFLCNLIKTPHEIISFFIDASSNSNNYIHPFLGQPCIPLLGKYSKDSYEMSSVMSLTITDYSLSKEDKNSDSSNLDNELINFLTNLNDIENNTKSENYINTLDNDINNVKFYWVTIQNNFIDQNDDKECSVFNIVPHLFLFKNLDFSKSKRITNNYPISIFISKNIEDSCGVSLFQENNKKNFSTNLNFNKLRTEYSSAHLIKNSLGFSPNNLKFLMNKNQLISHFYLILINENKIHVFYYWIINTVEFSTVLNTIFSESQTLSELMPKFTEFLGDQQCLLNIKSIFKIH